MSRSDNNCLAELSRHLLDQIGYDVGHDAVKSSTELVNNPDTLLIIANQFGKSIAIFLSVT